MPNHPTPKSICIVRLSAIGDTCHALAVVRAIQDYWPETAVTWIIGKTESALLADIPNIEFIIFDKRKGWGAVRDVAAKIGERKFDIALCMHASMRTNLLYRTIRSPRKIGFDHGRARDFQWLFTNERIERARNQHVLDGMLSFARHIGIEISDPRWDIPLGDDDLSWANDISGNHAPVLIISPCSSQRARNFRNWSVENYAEVARYALDTYGCKVVLTGGPSQLEKEYGVRLRELLGGGVTNLIGKTTLKQLLALIAASRAVICPDSGPAHLGTAVGTPVIGLYASSNPERSGPYLSRDLTVNAYPQAVGRYLGKSVDQVRWGRRVRDPDVMSLIKASQVKEKIDHVLGN